MLPSSCHTGGWPAVINHSLYLLFVLRIRLQSDQQFVRKVKPALKSEFFIHTFKKFRNWTIPYNLKPASRWQVADPNFLKTSIQVWYRTTKVKVKLSHYFPKNLPQIYSRYLCIQLISSLLHSNDSKYFKTVLRIHDILPLTNGSGSSSRRQQKTNF